MEAFHHGQDAGGRDLQLFAHVTDDFVEQQDHRGAVGLGQIEGFHRHAEDVLDGGCREGDDGVVAMGPPARLHHVALGAFRGQARGGAAALHIDDNAGDLGHDGVAQGLLLQGKAGAGRGCHGFGAGQGGAADGAHGGNLVFHLHEAPAHAGQFFGQVFGDLSGRRDGVAGKKTYASVERPANAGLVTLHKTNFSAHCCTSFSLPSSGISMARSGQ